MNNEPSQPRSKAVPLNIVARLELALGMILCAAGIVALLVYTPSPWPDLLLGVLGIGVLVCGILAVIGRLPSGFELAGFRFDFEADELADLIGTVKSSLASDPLAQDTIIKLIKKGTDRREFNRAISRSANGRINIGLPAVSNRHQGDRDENTPTTISHDAENPAILAYILDVLKATVPDPKEIEERFSVPTGSRGQRPIFNFYLKQSRTVVQFERYWNYSTVDLFSRKVARALEKSTPVNNVVLVTPKQGVETFRDGIDNDSVAVIALDDLTPKTLSERLPAIKS